VGWVGAVEALSILLVGADVHPAHGVVCCWQFSQLAHMKDTDGW
jgi:hypothetical protein